MTQVQNYDIYVHDGGPYGYDVAKIVTKRDEVPLVAVQDVHIGAGSFYRKKFDDLIQYIQDTDALWFYNGDGIDNGTRYSPGCSALENDMTPNQQVRYLYEKLAPIKYNCIGLVGGNHDHRTKKESYYDITEELSYFLNAHYFGYEMYFVVTKRDPKNGGTAYTVYSNHSASAHKNAGSGANYMTNNWMPWLENVDIMCKGHDHNVGLFPVGSTYFDTSNVVARDRVRWLWMPGSFLAKGKGYAAKKPYAPQPKIYYSLMLDMRKGHKRVDEVKHYL